jgi:hypothetical protein
VVLEVSVHDHRKIASGDLVFKLARRRFKDHGLG